MIAIDIGGVVHHLLSKYVIPPYLSEDYINNPCVIFTDPPIHVPDGYQCALCDRPKDDLPGHTLTMCRNSRLNQSAGYVLKICVYCKYWCLVNIEHYDCDLVPAKIYRHMIRPKNIDRYLSL